MDKIFVDQLINNKAAFIHTYLYNFKNFSIGLGKTPDFQYLKKEWLLEKGFNRIISLFYEIIASAVITSWPILTLCLLYYWLVLFR